MPKDDRSPHASPDNVPLISESASGIDVERLLIVDAFPFIPSSSSRYIVCIMFSFSRTSPLPPPYRPLGLMYLNSWTPNGFAYQPSHFPVSIRSCST